MLIIGSEYDMVIESTKTSGRGMYVSSAVSLWARASEGGDGKAELTKSCYEHFTV